MKLQQAVIIDIDGTLVKHSLEHWFLRYLLQNRHIHIGEILANLGSSAIRQLPLKWYQLKLVYLCGQHEEKVAQWIQSCWRKTIQNRLHPGMVELVHWFRSIKSHVVLLSGTPYPLAVPLMEFLQVPDAICAEPEIENGIYTGRLLRPHPTGMLKVKYADNWLRANGYTWDQVTAIGDNWQDRFLLSHVKHPIVIQPGIRLTRHARQESWLIVTNPFDKQAIITKVKSYCLQACKK